MKLKKNQLRRGFKINSNKKKIKIDLKTKRNEIVRDEIENKIN
jgi:hypothetical protein